MAEDDSSQDRPTPGRETPTTRAGDSNNDDLADRMTKLELRMRGMTIAIIVMLVGVGLAFLLGRASVNAELSSDILTAAEFRLTDEGGAIVGRWKTSNGLPILALNGKEGVTVALSVSPDEAGLAILGSTGVVRAAFTESGFVFNNPEGTPCAGLATLQGEDRTTTALALFDADGKEFAIFESERATVWARAFRVFDEKKKPCGEWTCSESGSELQLFGENGTTAALIARSTASLALIDGDANVYLKAEYEKQDANLSLSVRKNETLRLGTHLDSRSDLGLAIHDAGGIERIYLGTRSAKSDSFTGLLGQQRGVDFKLSGEDSVEVDISVEDGARLWLGTYGDGCPALHLFDAEERARLTLGCASRKFTATGEQRRSPDSSLHLFDCEGKVLFKAP